MSVSIPSSFSFELLSRLPPSSFVIEERVFRPDVPQQAYNLWNWESAPAPGLTGAGNQGTDVGRDVTFHLRAATNEMLLNSEVYVTGNARASVDYGAANFTPDGPTQGYITTPLNNASALDGSAYLPFQPIFSSSRESFNSGALPLLDNNDQNHARVHNSTRTLMVREPVHAPRAINGEQNNLDCVVYGQGTLAQLANLTIPSMASSVGPLTERSKGVNRRNFLIDGGPAEGVVAGAYNFRYPLGLYSALVSSHSVLPIGLFSAYSVDGWAVSLRLEDPRWSIFRSAMNSASGVVTPNIAGAELRGLSIVAKVVKILDPAVMSAILSLYEKSQSASVGGVEFPLSLRLNQINYRHYSFPLQNQSKYYWRLPTTDKSIRGVAWQVHYRRSYAGYQNGALGIRSQTGIGREEQAVSLIYPVGVDGDLHLTRAFFKAGSMKLMDGPVEDCDCRSDQVGAWVDANIAKVGAQFSPYPAYQENLTHNKGSEDFLSRVRHGRSTPASVVCPSENTYNLMVGAFSCQNMDYREPEYSTSFQASGIDLTNVGGFDVELTIQSAPINYGVSNDGTMAPFTADSSWTNSDLSDYEISFQIAYDTILETSPQGVMDITNAVI